MMYEPGLHAHAPLTRRQRALIEAFRRACNVAMPIMVALGVAMVIWIAARTIAAADQVARPMAAASRASA